MGTMPVCKQAWLRNELYRSSRQIAKKTSVTCSGLSTFRQLLSMDYNGLRCIDMTGWKLVDILAVIQLQRAFTIKLLLSAHV